VRRIGAVILAAAAQPALASRNNSWSCTVRRLCALLFAPRRKEDVTWSVWLLGTRGKLWKKPLSIGVRCWCTMTIGSAELAVPLDLG
jgi:hypothetical protein